MGSEITRFQHRGTTAPPALIVALLAAPIAALADEAQAAARLNELLSKARTITADFSQMTLSANGANMQDTSGTMVVKRPGMFRWHTNPPLEQELVSNGETIWLYDPDLMQVTVQKMDKRLTHTPALLLSGDVSALQENFAIAMTEGGSVVDFVLTPKANDSMFDSLRLSFREQAEDGSLRPPCGPQEIDEWQRHRAWLGEPGTFVADTFPRGWLDGLLHDHDRVQANALTVHSLLVLASWHRVFCNQTSHTQAAQP